MTSTPESIAGSRLAALDIARGAIMVLMAIDHASLFVAEQHFGEFWGLPLPDYGDAASLLTRVVTHVCAPGFCLLMGAGMMLFAESRRARGWTDARIARHFLLRGAILIAVDLFIIDPAWVLGSIEVILRDEPLGFAAVPGGGGVPYLVFGVLAALGAAMMLAGGLTRVASRWLVVLAVAVLGGCAVLLPDASQVAAPQPVVARALLIAGQTGPVMVAYPLLPWFAVCLLGMAWGRVLRRDARRALAVMAPLGVAALALFVVVRVAGGFGTYHAMPSPDWMGVLSVTKYPPSLAYLLLTLGVNALFLAAAARLPAGARSGETLAVFGRTPLFFYVLHLYVYALIGLAIPGHTSLAAMYVVWLIGLAILYPACVGYARFKGGKPDASIWRLF